ncbi:hypothetical protein HDU88_003003 [Geranomyces variabilis]|nr:hypothetical protein HDU88_003003 [Geranomyces variabilis]
MASLNPVTSTSSPPDILFIAEGIRFEAHSAILGKLNPPLLLPPSAVPPGSSPYTIVLPDIFSAAAFRCFLSYLYTTQYQSPTPPPPAPATAQNPIPTPQPPAPAQKPQPPNEKSILYSVSLPRVLDTTPTLLVQVYRLAAEFNVPGLKAAVARDMTNRLNERNCREFAECAEALQCEPVAVMVQAFVGKNTTRLFRMRMGRVEDEEWRHRAEVDNDVEKQVLQAPSAATKNDEQIADVERWREGLGE